MGKEPFVWKMGDSLTKAVLLHLFKRGSISPMEALISYGNMRLASDIHRLRKRGYEIRTEMNEDEGGHKYARYYMVKGRDGREYKNSKMRVA